MGANTLHLKGGEALTAPIQTARFVCKAERVRELTDALTHIIRQSPFQVVKIIELTEAQYQHYAAHLGEEAPFITTNQTIMGTDKHGVTRCLLITVRSRRDGILIDAQGYDYALLLSYYRDKLLPKSAGYSDGALQPEATGAPEGTGQMTRPFLLLENASLKEHPINLPLRDGPSGAEALTASGGEGASIAQMYICALARVNP